jgi:D-lactate dehydrogenase (cytochrome)
VTIRLAPVLPTTVAVVQFPDVRKATEAVSEVVNRGVGIRACTHPLSPVDVPASNTRPPPAECVELCDDDFMRATNEYGMSMRKWPEKDSLFFKFQGHSEAALADTARVTKEIVERHGGTGFSLAESGSEATNLWADRKNALYSGLALVEGSRGWSTDVW